MEKLNEMKQNEKKIFLKFEIFYENHPPTRHIKYKRIDLAPCNKSNMASKLFQPIWNDFQHGLTLRSRVKSAKYIAR